MIATEIGADQYRHSTVTQPIKVWCVYLCRTSGCRTIFYRRGEKQNGIME